MLHPIYTCTSCDEHTILMSIENVAMTLGQNQWAGWTYSCLSNTGLYTKNLALAFSSLQLRMYFLIFCSNSGRALSYKSNTEYLNLLHVYYMYIHQWQNLFGNIGFGLEGQY